MAESFNPAQGASIPATTAILKGNNAGSAVAASPSDVAGQLAGQAIAPSSVTASTETIVTNATTARLNVNSTAASPNAGIALWENGVKKWTIASYQGGTFTFFNEATVTQALGINASTNDVALSGNLTASGCIKGGVLTVATLPTASTAGANTRAYVSDATVAYTGANVGSVVAGGGSNKVPVITDGSAWYIG